MTLIPTLILFALAAWFLYGLVSGYAAATGSPWERLVTAAGDSATKLWAKVVALGSAAVGGIVYLSDFLGDPSLSAAIRGAIKPEYVPIFVIAVSVVTIIARNRTMSK